MVDLSIIIVSFNTRELLDRCLCSIYLSHSKIPYEIFVVDNSSSDGSNEMVKAKYPQVKLILNSENVGFARANNEVMKIAKGKYYLLLNSDTIVEEGTIDTLVNFIERYPKAAAVGPKILNYDGSLQSKGYYFPSIFFTFFTLTLLLHLCS